MRKITDDFKAALVKFRGPTAPGDIEWKIQTVNQFKGSAMVLPYIRKPACIIRLEECFGMLGWQNQMTRNSGDAGRGGCLCTIRVCAKYDDDSEQWIEKTDAGGDSSFEAFKGAASDSFKRACKLWGYGRDLDDFPTIYIELKENPNYDSKNQKSKKFYESIEDCIFEQLHDISEEMEKPKKERKVQTHYKLKLK